MTDEKSRSFVFSIVADLNTWKIESNVTELSQELGHGREIESIGGFGGRFEKIGGTLYVWCDVCLSKLMR